MTVPGLTGDGVVTGGTGPGVHAGCRHAVAVMVIVVVVVMVHVVVVVMVVVVVVVAVYGMGPGGMVTASPQSFQPALFTMVSADHVISP